VFASAQLKLGLDVRNAVEKLARDIGIEPFRIDRLVTQRENRFVAAIPAGRNPQRISDQARL